MQSYLTTKDPDVSIWLRPADQRVAQLYKEYTRSQIRNVLKPIYILIFLVILVAMIIALAAREFNEIPTRGYQINLVYFFQATAMFVVLAVCDGISRRYSSALDLIIPLFAICDTMLCLPYWMHPLSKPITIPESGPWFATSNALFIVNLFIGIFFTSNYALSMSSRSLITLNSFNVCLRLYVNDLR